MKLRSQMLLLVCGALAPLLIVAAVGGTSMVRDERQRLERDVLGITRAAMTAIDAELRGVLSALIALAASQNLDEGDYRAFHDECRLVARQTRWLDVSLADGEGRRIFDTASPFGVVREGVLDRESLDRVLRTARPAIGIVGDGPTREGKSVPIRYPVVRAGRTAFVLTAHVAPALFSDVLAAQRLPADWIVALADRDRRFVARLPARPPGDPISSSFQAALDSAPEGFFPGTTVEGLSVYTPYVTSPLSGWALGIAMPASSVYAGTGGLVAAIAGGVLLALAAALGLAWLLARRMTRPIASLAAAGQALQRGQVVELQPPGRIDEIVQLQAAMLDAFAAARERQAVIERQVTRLKLLDRITSAVATHQDLRSIYQVVIRSVEDGLPLDFACICSHDAERAALTVTQAGVHSEALATALATTAEGRISVDDNGLSRCVRGEFVEEPDIAALPGPFAQRLLAAGLRSLVLSPLTVDGQVLSVLLAARAAPNAFDAGECEFLRQLSAHTALAVRQAELNRSLSHAYEELRQTQQTALQQERLRSLGQMASGIAHDINNAIVPAMLYVEGLLESEQGLSGPGRHQLEIVLRAIGDVAATVARMGEFYRQQDRPLAATPLSLNRVAQQVVELTRARWSDMPQQRGFVVKLRTELEDDLPDVGGVENEIREALINLVFNAVDAMPDGGELVIRTRRLPPEGNPGEESVCIEVTDSGVGMDDETRRRCMEPFFTTKGERGTGLGLAMVYGVAKRHGAAIDVASEVGRGTTIGLRFALIARAAPSPAPPADASGQAPAPIGRKARVLVIDDDPLVLQTLKTMLQTSGNEVVPADGGQAGIDAFAATLAGGSAFDIVFTDLGMPHVDGHTVAAAIKRASPTTPVILLTGWGQSGADERPKNIDLVMAKPPKLRDIRDVVARFARASA